MGGGGAEVPYPPESRARRPGAEVEVGAYEGTPERTGGGGVHPRQAAHCNARGRSRRALLAARADAADSDA